MESKKFQLKKQWNSIGWRKVYGYKGNDSLCLGVVKHMIGSVPNAIEVCVNTKRTRSACVPVSVLDAKVFGSVPISRVAGNNFRDTMYRNAFDVIKKALGLKNKKIKFWFGVRKIT